LKVIAAQKETTSEGVAYRGFCASGLDSVVPDRSTFSKKRLHFSLADTLLKRTDDFSLPTEHRQTRRAGHLINFGNPQLQ
jgi:hypothetical protein